MTRNKKYKFDDFYDKITGNRDISFLVIHHTQANNVEEAIALYKKHEVSAHYAIDEKGEIFCLVDDNDVAYHAGISYWNGVDGLNATSIGIELVCQNPDEIGYSDLQMDALIALCCELKAKYNIKINNIVGHSDIAYFRDSGYLDRKQDPSHLFDWQKMCDNGLAYEHSLFCNIGDFIYGMRDEKIIELKNNAKDIGYKVSNLDDVFDDEMMSLVTVIERRFLR